MESCRKRKTRNGYKNKKGDSFMRLRQEIKAFLMDEEAIGTVEVVLLLVEIFIPYYQVCIRCIK